MPNILVTGLSHSSGSFGGVVKFTKTLVPNLRKFGHNSNFFSFGRSPNWFKSDKKISRVRYEALHFIKFFSFLKIISKRGVDIIHFNVGLTSKSLIRMSFFLVAVIITNRKSILSIHGWNENFFREFSKTWMSKTFYLSVLSKHEHIFVSSHEYKEKIIDIGLKSNFISVIPTMVSTSVYSSKKNFHNPNKKVIFCGSLFASKGINELIEAIPEVLEKNPTTKFVIIGSSSDELKLKIKIKELMLNNNVLLTGFIDESLKIKIFKAGHIFVLPSYSEGFPNVITESMSAGLPIVCTNVGGMADAIENYTNGLKLESLPPEPKEIADCINTLLSNTILMEKISQNNFKCAKERYDISSVISKISEKYNQI